jgi:hypothetical protein
LAEINKNIIIFTNIFLIISGTLFFNILTVYDQNIQGLTNLSLNNSQIITGNHKFQIDNYKNYCCEGYTLLDILYFGAVLIDMNGSIVKNWWPFIPTPAKMISDGSIVIGNGFKLFGFSTGDVKYLLQIDWDNNILWSFNNWEDNRSRQHHDFQREGNPVGYYAPGQDFISFGNTLILAHKNIINTSISRRPLLDDIIYEINWNGSLTGFEWNGSDYYSQIGFNDVEKHGIYVNPGILGDGDWLHLNTICLVGENKWYTMDPVNYSYFNPNNIIIDSRNANFIAIISRETGDIVWKLGPNYRTNKPVIDDKLGLLIGSHDAHIIPKGLPGEGNFLVFDNGGISGYGYLGMPKYYRLWSRVVEFNPITLEIIWEYKFIKLFWLFPRTGANHRFFSYYIGSAQRLPNGNTLITEGANGRVIEVTNKSEIVWECTTPTRLGQIYRAYRIPPEWIPGNPSGYKFWNADK